MSGSRFRNCSTRKRLFLLKSNKSTVVLTDGCFPIWKHRSSQSELCQDQKNSDKCGWDWLNCHYVSSSTNLLQNNTHPKKMEKQLQHDVKLNNTVKTKQQFSQIININTIVTTILKATRGRIANALSYNYVPIGVNMRCSPSHCWCIAKYPNRWIHNTCTFCLGHTCCLFFAF